MSCCGYENQFSANPQYLEFKKDKAGYALDLDGNQIMSDFGPVPAHFGRRCMGMVAPNLAAARRGEYERCGYRWTFKECPHCLADNDIAARYCSTCKGEIVDPNEKLKADFKALKRDPTRLQTDEVTHMSCAPGVSRSGNRTMRVEWITPYRRFTTWLMPEAAHTRGQAEWGAFEKATDGGATKPRTITYQKNAASGFFEIKAYNRAADEEPREARKHAAE